MAREQDGKASYRGSNSPLLEKITQALSEDLQAPVGAISAEMNLVVLVGAEKTMVERLSQHISSNTS